MSTSFGVSGGFETFQPTTGKVKKKRLKRQKRQEALDQSRFASFLRNMFQTQFANQQETLNFLLDKLKPLAETGFFEGEEAALRTGASEQVSREFTSAQQNLQRQAFRLGGRQLPSGAQIGLTGQLELARARASADAQRDITLRGSELRRQSLFQSAGLLSGVAGLQSPNAILGGGIQQGQGAFQSLGTFDFSSGFGKILSGALGGLAGAFTGGLSTAIGGLGQQAGGALGELFGGKG